jgi:hypothetical protein
VLREAIQIAALIGCTVSELGERMSAEEFGWWATMIEQDWIGPGRQARLLAHIAAGVRNGPVQGPDGEKSVWQADDFIDKDRWKPPEPEPEAPGIDQVKAWFSRFGL